MEINALAPPSTGEENHLIVKFAVTSSLLVVLTQHCEAASSMLAN